MAVLRPSQPALMQRSPPQLTPPFTHPYAHRRPASFFSGSRGGSGDSGSTVAAAAGAPAAAEGAATPARADTLAYLRARLDDAVNAAAADGWSGGSGGGGGECGGSGGGAPSALAADEPLPFINGGPRWWRASEQARLERGGGWPVPAEGGGGGGTGDGSSGGDADANADAAQRARERHAQWRELALQHLAWRRQLAPLLAPAAAATAALATRAAAAGVGRPPAHSARHGGGGGRSTTPKRGRAGEVVESRGGQSCWAHRPASRVR